MTATLTGTGTDGVFRMPDLGEGLTEAEIVAWRVSVGDVVAIDQIVVEVETAKAAVEVPIPIAGTVTRLYGEAGTVIDVGAPLIAVHVPDERYREEERAGSGNVLIGYGTGAAPRSRRRRAAPTTRSTVHPPAAPPRPADAPRVISPVVRGLARTRGIDVAALTPSGPGGVVLRRDIDAAAAAAVSGTAAAGPGAIGTAAAAEPGEVRTAGSPLGGGRTSDRVSADLPFATPTAGADPVGRATATTSATAGTNPPDAAITTPTTGAAITTPTTGAAPAGRATATTNAPASMSSATAGANPARAAITAATTDGDPAAPVRVPLRGPRRAVADKLSRSRREIPDATTWVDVDATALLELKEEINRACPGAGVGTMALLCRICVAGLRRFPELNAYVDTERAEIVQVPQVHLGFAAQTDRGLVVPVVRDAHRRTLAELAARLRELTHEAREGRLSPRDLTGGTFTLNNYGVFGVDGASPIINHPEAAMLGVGRVIDRPWAVDGRLTLRRVTQLSLAFDHRVCDGGVAGGFLRFVADCVERPQTLIAHL